MIALKETGEKTVPCLKISNLSEEEKLQIMMMDNTSVLMSGIDEEGNIIQNSDYAIACKLLNKRVLV